MPPLDCDKWANLPSPFTKWIVQTVYNPPVGDLEAGDEIYFEFISKTSPPPPLPPITTIKIKDVKCTHTTTKHSGASWKGMVLTGGGPMAGGDTVAIPPALPVPVVIQSSYPGNHHLECTGTTGGSGSGCWTADAG